MPNTTTKPKCKNPIVETYKGRNVWQYPLIQIRVSIPEYKRFIDAEIDFGLSPKQAIAQGKALCNLCHNIEVKKPLYAKSY